MKIPYERIEHTADLAIRVTGEDLPALFANAAAALFDLMAEPPAAVDRQHEVVVESIDLEGLLVDWLNKLIFMHEVNDETYTRFEITALSPEELRATVRGGATTRKLKTVKAATFHELTVAETEIGAQAQIIFDV
ncbi:MAG: archease [Armatimonadota bacterium]